MTSVFFMWHESSPQLQKKMTQIQGSVIWVKFMQVSQPDDPEYACSVSNIINIKNHEELTDFQE